MCFFLNILFVESTPLCQLTVAVSVIGHIYQLLFRTNKVNISLMPLSVKKVTLRMMDESYFIHCSHTLIFINPPDFFWESLCFVFLKNTDNGFMFTVHVEPHLLLKNSFVSRECLEQFKWEFFLPDVQGITSFFNTSEVIFHHKIQSLNKYSRSRLHVLVDCHSSCKFDRNICHEGILFAST